MMPRVRAGGAQIGTVFRNETFGSYSENHRSSREMPERLPLACQGAVTAQEIRLGRIGFYFAETDAEAVGGIRDRT